MRDKYDMAKSMTHEEWRSVIEEVNGELYTAGTNCGLVLEMMLNIRSCIRSMDDTLVEILFEIRKQNKAGEDA